MKISIFLNKQAWIWLFHAVVSAIYGAENLSLIAIAAAAVYGFLFLNNIWAGAGAQELEKAYGKN